MGTKKKSQITQLILEVAKDISNSLAKVAVAGKINGQLRDLVCN
jgi:hypothetical protein